MTDTSKTKKQLLEELQYLRKELKYYKSATAEKEEERSKSSDNYGQEDYFSLESIVFEKLYNNGPVGIFMTAEDLRIIKANPVFCSMLGYTEDELKKKTLIDITYPDDIDRDMPSLIKLISSEIPYFQEEKRYVKNSGEVIWAKIADSHIELDGNGSKIIVAAVIDITENKKNIEMLRDTDNRFRLLFEFAPCGYYLHDLNGIFKDGNRAAEKIIGYNREELIGRNIFDAGIIPEKYVKKIEASIKLNAAGLPSGPLEISLRRKKGALVPVEIQTLPININGETLVIGIAVDITERKKAFAALKEKNELLNSVIDVSPLALIALDLEDRVIIWNRAAEEMFGWKCEEAAGGLLPIIPESGKEEHAVIKEILLREGRIENYEMIRTGKDGRSVAVVLSSVCVRNHKEEVTGFISFYSDTTSIKFSELKYKAMFDTMVQGVVYQDEKGKIINVNSAAERILGLSLQEMTGRTSHDARWKALKEDGTEYPGDEHPATIALREGKEIKNSIMGINKPRENDYRWLMVSAVPIYRPGSTKPYEVYSTFEDVTELRNARHALEISERKNRDILGVIPDLIFTYNREAVCTSYKADPNSYLRFESSIFLNKRIDEYAPEHIAKMFHENLNKAFNTGQLQTYIFNMKIKDEMLHMEGRMIKYEEDEVLILVRDITQRIKNEQRQEEERRFLEELVKERTKSLFDANKKLEIEIEKQKEYDRQIKEALEKEKELNDLKSRFISTASHEFRTPLTSILASADLLELYGFKWPREKFEEHIRRIQNGVTYMNTLLNDVLSVNSMEHKNSKISPALVDLFKLAGECFEEAKHSATSGHRLTYDFKCASKKFYLDEKLMRQIISNLLVNAVKYSPDGGDVLLEVNDENSHILIKVSDQGIGIAKKDLNRLFEPFHRGENCGNISGTGLGMTIVKSAVGLHNGEISVESKLGKGTIIKIQLPILLI